MSTIVFLAVIFAAFIHSIWNGMIKKQDDKYIAMAALVLGHVPLSIVVIIITPMISLESIPYIFISSIFLAGYKWCLLSAYRLEDYTNSSWISANFYCYHILTFFKYKYLKI